MLGIADAFRKVVFGEDLWQIAAGTVAMGAQIAWHEVLIIGEGVGEGAINIGEDASDVRIAIDDVIELTCEAFGSELWLWQAIERADHCCAADAGSGEDGGVGFIHTTDADDRDVDTGADRFQRIAAGEAGILADTWEEGTDAKIICAVSDGFFGLFEGFRSDADDLIRAELGARACGGSVFLANVDTICVERKGEGDVVVDDKWHVVFMAERLERFCILARFAVLVAVLQHGSATGENSFCARQERFSLQVVTIGDHI